MSAIKSHACLSLPLITVNLTADAVPIPGGYVVPERGSVTFTCSSSSGGSLFWNVTVPTLRNPRGRVEISAGRSVVQFPGFSVPDESPTANPTSFTFHNISLVNNPSPVGCRDPIVAEESSSIIIVEGEVSLRMLYQSGPAGCINMCYIFIL